MRELIVAWRTLRKRPGFTAVGVLTLALGVGASTAMFSVIESALLRPLPFIRPDGLAVLWGVAGPERQIRGASYPEFTDWRATPAVREMSVYDPGPLNLTGAPEAEQVLSEIVSANYFNILGARALLGRGLEAGDDQVGGPRVAVLSHDLWQRRYGSDPAIVGRTIDVQGRPLTVAGVMAPSFNGLSFQSQLWTTHAALSPDVIDDRGNRWLMVIGRLEPAQTIETAQASVRAIAKDLEARYPETHAQRSANVISIREFYLGTTQRMLVVLFGAVVLLLLIACVNVTSLQLVRATGRTAEMSLRHALGASRGRLVRQLLAEGFVLSMLGGAAGLFIGYASVQALLPFLPAGVLPPYATVSLNAGIAAFALGAAVLCGTLSALMPALRLSAGNIATNLRQRGAIGQGHQQHGFGAQQVLVAGEVALAFLLLVCAGLMLRSLQQQLRIDLGFVPDNVIAAQAALPGVDYPAERRRLFVQLVLERVRALPGVTAAAVGSDAPLRGAYNAGRLQRAGHNEDAIRYYRHRVTADYFRVLGIDVVRGRPIDDTDQPSGERVVVISQAGAERLWPNQDALGQQVRLGVSETAPVATVVGVVGNARQRTIVQPATAPEEDPDFYLPYAQQSTGQLELLVRYTGQLQALTPMLRRIVAEIDPDVPLNTVDALDASVAAATSQTRFASFLLGLFAFLAVTLAAIGLYGVMAYYVSTTRKEMAIRLAIGAQPQSLRRLILRRGGRLVVVGTVIGAVAALGLTRVLSSLLFGVKPNDPWTFIGVAALLGSVAFLANYIPARRAASILPHSVLKGEG